MPTAFRETVTDIVRAPYPIFWGGEENLTMASEPLGHARGLLGCRFDEGLWRVVTIVPGSVVTGIGS